VYHYSFNFIYLFIYFTIKLESTPSAERRLLKLAPEPLLTHICAFCTCGWIMPCAIAFMVIAAVTDFLSKLGRPAATDYVTWKSTVDVCNRIDYVVHDWHGLALDKLPIFIQRCCAHHFLFSENLGFSRVQNFCCWTCESCKHLRKCKR